MPFEIMTDSHYKPSILACHDYLVREGATNIGFELPANWSNMLKRKSPEYQERKPSVGFTYMSQLSLSREFLEAYRRASPPKKLELKWPIIEKDASHVKLFMLLAGSGLQFRFFCYEGDDGIVEESARLPHRIADILKSNNPFFIVTQDLLDLYGRYAKTLDYRDKNNSNRIRRQANAENSHLISGYHHAPYLHRQLNSRGNLVITRPDEYTPPDLELILRLREGKIDHDTATRLVRKQRKFLLDVKSSEVNIAEGISDTLAVEHMLKTTARVYEEVFPELKFKYP